jgi:hypothetical protein
VFGNALLQVLAEGLAYVQGMQPSSSQTQLPRSAGFGNRLDKTPQTNEPAPYTKTLRSPTCISNNNSLLRSDRKIRGSGIIDDNPDQVDPDSRRKNTIVPEGYVGKRGRLTSLEKSRLRAWKTEKKDDAWIATKLRRPVSSIAHHWSKIQQGNS